MSAAPNEVAREGDTRERSGAFCFLDVSSRRLGGLCGAAQAWRAAFPARGGGRLTAPAVLLGAIVLCGAAPAPGSEDAALLDGFGDWIRSQYRDQANHSGWCCDGADGRPLFDSEWRPTDEGVKVFVSRRHWPDAPAAGLWIDVPRARFSAPSPLGLPVLLWTAAGGVYCFAPVGGI